MTLVLIPLEVKGDEVKIQAKLFNGPAGEETLQFSRDGMVLVNGIKATQNRELTVIVPLNPNTTQVSIRAEVVGRGDVSKEIKVEVPISLVGKTSVKRNTMGVDIGGMPRSGRPRLITIRIEGTVRPVEITVSASQRFNAQVITPELRLHNNIGAFKQMTSDNGILTVEVAVFADTVIYITNSETREMRDFLLAR